MLPQIVIAGDRDRLGAHAEWDQDTSPASHEERYT